MHILTLFFIRLLIWCFMSSMTLYAAVDKPATAVFFTNGVDNQIKKVVNHQGPIACNMVCLCSAQPIINHIPDQALQKMAGVTTDPNRERYRFFMPKTSVSKENLKLLNRSSDLYTITVRPTTSPMKGLECIVDIDKNKVGFQVEVFDSITGDKGVSFKFLMRDALQQVNHKSHPIIRTAHIVDTKKKFMLS